MACPDPQATSATSMPSVRRSGSPGTSGTTTSSRVASNTMALSSAISRWNSGYCEYGTPPPFLKQSAMPSSTLPSMAMNWLNDAMLPGPAARVSEAACSGGSRNSWPSCSTIPPVTIAPNHSRT